MKKAILFLGMLLAVTMHSKAQYVAVADTVPLWPNGAPVENGLTTGFQDTKFIIMNNHTAYLHIYKAQNPNGMCVLACPGGGYIALAMQHEGSSMAMFYNRLGITLVVLQYRMPNGHSEIPLSDGEEAMRYIRRHAAEWGVDPHKVGVQGASAGGHLAASLATLYSSEETRPDFQILYYPVISMKPGITHAGSRSFLITANPTPQQEERFTLEKQVNSHTPQAFIMLSADDDVVPPVNSLDYFKALVDNKVPASMHIFPTGGHGWGWQESFKYHLQVEMELEKWLETIYK